MAVVSSKDLGLSLWSGGGPDGSCRVGMAAGKSEAVISLCVTVRCAPV